jgi:small subunit ribosomal protein S16
VAVRIRLKKMGRKARPFFRVCAVDSRAPRDGKVIEELGYYDPMLRETDARAILKSERIDYWISVGAQPSQKAGVLIKKYGSAGTHLSQQKAALERLKSRSSKPSFVPSTPAAATEAPAAEAPAAEAPESEVPAAASPEASPEAASTEDAS